jgi:AcrR family transcriptional regulator
MSRFTREDWLKLGARLLGEEGAAALTIERLTAAAGRTRGSFYHHFADRDAFVRAMMERWRSEVIDVWGLRYQLAGSASELRRLMREQPMELDHSFERATRRWATSEPIVREVLDAVDRARIEGLGCVLAHLRPELEDPQSAAFVQYSALVGMQWLLESLDDPRLPAIRKVANRIFALQEPDED